MSTRSLSMCIVILGLTGVSHEVSTKLDFGEDSSPITTKTSKEDEDVVVQHTIVVSTKLNNNRRGLHTNVEDGTIYNHEQNKSVKQDSGEVPIVKAYKSVETTQIRTPDTRFKTTAYPNFHAINSNTRDEYDLYPNLAANPMQWKPSPAFNNVNWWNQDNGVNFDNYIRRNRPDYQKLHRKVTDDGVREFYCNKCREFGGPRGCVQRRDFMGILSNRRNGIPFYDFHNRCGA